MPTSRKPKHEADSGFRFLWGLILLPLALLLLLGLGSYQWQDVFFYQSPPTSPPANLIGPVGVWLALLLYSLFGPGAYAVPAAFILAGVILLVVRQAPVRGRLFWCCIALLSLVALLDIAGLFAGAVESLNIPHDGGLLGLLVTHGLLVRWLGQVGAVILTSGLLAVALLLFCGTANLVRAARMLWMAIRVLAGRLGDGLSQLNQRKASLEEEERRVERERRQIEKRLRKQKLVEQIRQAGNRPAKPEPEPATPTPVRRKPEPRPEPVAPPAPPPPPAANLPPQALLFPGYRLPPITLLDEIPAGHRDAIETDTAGIAALLIDTLAEFGIQAEATDVAVGPVVTRYEVLPAPGVRVERIASLANNIALTLKATSVRVQAPIPGKGVVGIEIPNEISKVVYVREVLESKNWQDSTAHLPLILGKDVSGKDIVADLARMPHLLIAGATGSGKSVCMNSILAGLLMARTPDELRLILVDPKIVEFAVYSNLPHLVVPVITDPKKVALGLRWAITEMEKRYKQFAKAKVRNIEGFNNRQIVRQEELFNLETEPAPPPDDLPARLPYIVIIIDELADLMLAAGADIENAIARLAQLSRAVGIHMIIATQRPSVNVITGTIKANFPARIAFQVAQKVDSRTILDQSGADKLLGRGDMLYLPPSASKLIRAQGSMVSDDEIHRLTEFIKAQAEPAFEMEVKNVLDKADADSGSGSLDDGSDDELLTQAVEIIRETQRASTSSLQRRMRIGYTRAARVMDILEERGIVGPARGAEPREIMIDLDVDMSDTDVDQDTMLPEDDGEQ